MSDIALIMNGFLAVLLVGALGMGWRLERRLKALRASHASFAKAVEDLDRAAARAEQGLADLRAATDEAAESLAGRIDRAGSLAARLEELTSRAVNVEARLAAAPRPQPAPAPAPKPLTVAAPPPARPVAAARDTAFSRFAERYGVTSSAAPSHDARNDLILEDEPARSPGIARLERLRERLAPRGDDRRERGRDDELFDAPRAAGGRR